MKIYIQTTGAITPVKLVDNVPDWLGIEDPSLSILQAAFADGNYEIIPDPEPIEESPLLNWDGLYDQLIISNIYKHILEQSTQAQYAGISGVMTAFAAAIIVGKQEPSNPARLEAFKASVYGVLGTALALEIVITPEQLAEVRTILDVNGFNDVQLGN